MARIDLAAGCNIPSFQELEWFGDIPAGDVVPAGIPFSIRGPIVLTHGYVEDGKSGFYPGLYETARGEKYVRRLFDHILEVIGKCAIEDADGVGDNEYFLPSADTDGDGWPDRPGQVQAWDLTTSACRLSLWMRCVAQCMDSP